jgi:hypothetical protein
VGGSSEATTNPDRIARRRTKLRQASFADYHQIALLESRYGLEVKGLEEWTHLWLGNPLYRDLEADWTIGWVVEDENQQLVGSLENIPLLCEFDGRRVIAATGRALVLEPEYRSAALPLLNRVINQPAVDLYLNNTVSEASASCFSLFECPRVPVGLWDEAAFWITSYRGLLQILYNRYGARRHTAAAADDGAPRSPNPLNYRLSLLAFFTDRLANEISRTRDVEVQFCPEFDDRFDIFWEDLRKNNPRRLLAVRTREVLEWHFRYALKKNRVWVVAVVDGLRLSAYAIFGRDDYRHLKKVRLVDFQSLDGSTDLLAPMLNWALRKCRNEGIHMLENIGRWMEKGEFFETIAPYHRAIPNWTYFYRANNPSLAETLRDRRAWAPSLFDGDASL